MRACAVMDRVQQGWDQLLQYLPVALMGLLALGSWWLERNPPMPQWPILQRQQRPQPDYVMNTFSVKTFDAAGRLQSQVQGRELRHYPDTGMLEIDQAHMRSISPEGQITVA